MKKNKPAKPKKKSVYRSSVTGKIVTKAFALKNPATTYKDTIKNTKN